MKNKLWSDQNENSKTLDIEAKEDALNLRTELRISEARITTFDECESVISSLGNQQKNQPTPSDRRNLQFVAHSTPYDPPPVLTPYNLPHAAQSTSDNHGQHQQDGKAASPIQHTDQQSNTQDPSNKRPSRFDNSDSSEMLITALDGLADRLVNHDKLPRMMPEKFEGDLLQYPHWIKSFESIVETHANSVSQRMFFLGKCTGGEAYAAIQGFLALDSEEDFRAAKTMLHKRY